MSKKLLKEYHRVLKVEIDEGRVLDLTPTSVFVLFTRCNAVYRNYMSRFKVEMARQYADRDGLIGVIRQIMMERTDPSGDTQNIYSEEVLLNKFVNPSIDKSLLKSLIGKLSSKKGVLNLGYGRRYILRNGFKDVLTASCDVVVDMEEGDLELFKLSRAKDSSEVDRLTALTYLLLAAQTGDYSSITYTQFPIASPLKPKSITLHKEDLKENPKDTLLRIITDAGKDMIDQGKHCESCVHASYCPVLRDDIRDTVLEEGEKDDTN